MARHFLDVCSPCPGVESMQPLNSHSPRTTPTEPLSNPFHVPRTMITLYFRSVVGALNARDSILATIDALERIFSVDLKAARERIHDPKVPASGVTSFWKTTEIVFVPNPVNPGRLQAKFVRQALLGVIVFCMEEGWARRSVEIHHDKLGYIADIVYTIKT